MNDGVSNKTQYKLRGGMERGAVYYHDHDLRRLYRDPYQTGNVKDGRVRIMNDPAASGRGI